MADLTIRAAGVVLVDRSSREPRILLVHRPGHRDWSLPKGKLDKGESTVAAAVRECAEETGVTPILGPPLEQQRYPVMGRPKTVDYWMATPGRDRGFRADDEIDKIMWASPMQAKSMLSYDRDLDLVRRTLNVGRTYPLAILRHTSAVKRGDHKGADRRRPLTNRGRREAKELIPLLSAFGVTHVYSSDAARCKQSVAPYARSIKTRVRVDDVFSEQVHAKRPKAAPQRLLELADRTQALVVCTHRPVLPALLAALTTRMDARAAKALVEPLRPGGLVVAHRSFNGGKWRVVALERHENY
jgi:8-oxo-(d)GTP phosphatase